MFCPLCTFLLYILVHQVPDKPHLNKTWMEDSSQDTPIFIAYVYTSYIAPSTQSKGKGKLYSLSLFPSLSPLIGFGKENCHSRRYFFVGFLQVQESQEQLFERLLCQKCEATKTRSLVSKNEKRTLLISGSSFLSRLFQEKGKNWN